MLNKFLREIVTLVVSKQVEEIADLLNSKRYVNEFLIAKKLDITINQTRNILYRISDYGLVASIRKKDKKKGWYTYFWRFDILKCLEFLKLHLVKRRDQIQNQINSRETKKFFICERCSIEFNEENALLHNYECNECGDIFVEKDNQKVLKQLRRNLGKFERELDLLEVEIKKEEIKVEKAKLRLLRKEEKEELKRKVEAAAKRKATREKNAKEKAEKEKLLGIKPVKKATKKKVVKKKVTKKKPVKKATKKKVVRKKIIKKKSVPSKSKVGGKKKTKSAALKSKISGSAKLRNVFKLRKKK